MRRLVGAMAVALAGLAACSSGQAPDIPGPERAGTTGVTTPGNPGTSSNYPPRCPEGGPNETTPKAGCLTEDGTLVRP